MATQLNEKTSETVGSIAARGLQSGKLDEKDTRSVCASALVQVGHSDAEVMKKAKALHEANTKAK